MTAKIQINTKLIELAESIYEWSQSLLDKAALTDDQREDVVAIHTASHEFINFASSQMQKFTLDVDAGTKKQVRHKLRNYLNVIVGFSRLIVKELPDNLLLHMVIVRKIHNAGELLMLEVDAIQ